MGSFSVWHWLILLLVLLPGVLHLLNLQRAMEAIDAEMRPMALALAWLLLIQLVNIVWMFFVVTHLKTGYSKMGAAGRRTAESDRSYGVAVTPWSSAWRSASVPQSARRLRWVRWCSGASTG